MGKLTRKVLMSLIFAVLVISADLLVLIYDNNTSLLLDIGEFYLHSFKHDESQDDALVFSWNEPAFEADNETSINNKKYTLMIDGKLDENYHIVTKSKDKVLLDEVVTTNEYIVPSKLYKNKNVELEFNLYYNDNLISVFNAKNVYVVSTTTTTKEKNPIKEIKIKTPSSYTSLKEIKDIKIEFSGGDNSKEKLISIYENNKLLKKETLDANNYIVPAETFKDECLYKVTISATDGKFSRSETIYISTIKNGAKKMVDLARTQIGVKKGLKYSKWYGFNGRVEWCAVFISWLANENGFLNTVIPKFAGVGAGWRWFNSRGLTVRASKKYVPKTGDIVFFDFNRDGRIDHVGLVDYSDGKYVYTIEGNTKNDECKDNKYKIDYSGFYGFATPNY